MGGGREMRLHHRRIVCISYYADPDYKYNRVRMNIPSSDPVVLRGSTGIFIPTGLVTIRCWLYSGPFTNAPIDHVGVTINSIWPRGSRHLKS